MVFWTENYYSATSWTFYLYINDFSKSVLLTSWSSLSPDVISVFDEWDSQMFVFFFISPTICVFILFCWSDDLSRSTIGSSSDSEKMIQHLNDELQEAQELANSEKHKCREIQGKTNKYIHYLAHMLNPNIHLIIILNLNLVYNRETINIKFCLIQSVMWHRMLTLI